MSKPRSMRPVHVVSFVPSSIVVPRRCRRAVRSSRFATPGCTNASSSSNSSSPRPSGVWRLTCRLGRRRPANGPTSSGRSVSSTHCRWSSKPIGSPSTRSTSCSSNSGVARATRSAGSPSSSIVFGGNDPNRSEPSIPAGTRSSGRTRRGGGEAPARNGDRDTASGARHRAGGCGGGGDARTPRRRHSVRPSS